jgi:hypothetical protein
VRELLSYVEEHDFPPRSYVSPGSPVAIVRNPDPTLVVEPVELERRPPSPKPPVEETRQLTLF